MGPLSRGSHQFEVRSQQEVNALPGRKEVELTTEGGKTYLLYTITPQKGVHGEEDKVGGLFRTLFGTSTSSQPVRYAVEAPPAKVAMMRGELSVLQSLWMQVPGEINGVLISEWMAGRVITGELYDDIKQRQQEIADQRDSMQPFIEKEQNSPDVGKLHDAIFQPHTLKPIGAGQNGALLLIDEDGEKRAVVKAGDQDAFNLHNSNQLALPLPDLPQTRMCESIPHSISVQQEVLGYKMADLAGLGHVVPRTTMAIFRSSAFHVFADSLEGKVPPSILKDLRSDDEKLKLVSVQEYLPQSQSLIDALTEASATGEELKINQKDFEDTNLFMWISADQDGNNGNFMVYQKEDGSRGIKKIDNGQICGEDNGMINHLAYDFPAQMALPLSEEGKKTLLNVPVPSIADTMRELGRSEGAIQAFIGRIAGIQEFITSNPNVTLEEVNKYVRLHNSGIFS